MFVSGIPPDMNRKACSVLRLNWDKACLFSSFAFFSVQWTVFKTLKISVYMSHLISARFYNYFF